MFRELVRKNQALDEAECIRILKDEKRGVLSVLGDDEYPYGSPINHLYLEEDGCLYFHGGMQGHKIDAMKRHDKVSFCVYDQGNPPRPNKADWSLDFKCVIVFGRVEFIDDRDETIRISRLLCDKFTQDQAYIDDEVARSGARTLCFRLRPEHMTGKLVNES